MYAKLISADDKKTVRKKGSAKKMVLLFCVLHDIQQKRQCFQITEVLEFFAVNV